MTPTPGAGRAAPPGNGPARAGGNSAPPSGPLTRALLACALLAAVAVPGARAQAPKPWVPPGPDSIQALVSEARVRFRLAKVDSLTEETLVAYERVGQAARRLLRRLGRHNMISAPLIEATLDSLGADTDVINDPQLPAIVLVLVRNPERLTSQAVGYLLWYRGVDLRLQGMSFPPAVQPRIRSWWSGYSNAPYSTAIVYRARGTPGELGFKYLRMSPDGFYWDLVQYEGNGPNLGVPGDVAFADLNRDGRPELISYSPAPQDSVLMVESPVHPVVREVIYTDRGKGFVAHDARFVPGPLETLRLFLIALRRGERERAKSLLVDPALVDAAKAAGWAAERSPRSFVVDRQEEGQPWPEWLGARITGANGPRRFVFHFTLRDGRWLIRDWIAEETPRPGSAAGSPAKTGGQRP